MNHIRASIQVSGRVQGVWYRRFTQQTAQAHGVTGWVKNRLNGDVSAVFEGKEQAVKAVMNECRKGPDGAHVDHMEIVVEEFSGEFDHFDIKR